MKQLHIILLSLILSGGRSSFCLADEPVQQDVSRSAYEEYMKQHNNLHSLKPTYEDWRLFQEQDKLRTLYLKLLQVNGEEGRVKDRKGHDEYCRALDQYVAQQGQTNSLDESSAEYAQREQAVREFRMSFRPTQTNEYHAITVCWEMWCEYVNAEALFREKMAVAKVPPKAALEALTLSDAHRRAIGNVERYPGLHTYTSEGVQKRLQNGESAEQIESSYFKSSDIDHTRTLAKQVLSSFLPDLKKTPCCLKLVALAKEEISNSIEAEKCKRFWRAAQWADDAEVTARSAKALYELEKATVKPSGSEKQR